jgi:hypothetical protein
MKVLFFTLLAFLATACLGAHCRHAEDCQCGATRCTDNVAEICDAHGAYHELADCDLASKQSCSSLVCEHVEETTEDGGAATCRAVLLAPESER